MSERERKGRGREKDCVCPSVSFRLSECACLNHPMCEKSQSPVCHRHRLPNEDPRSNRVLEIPASQPWPDTLPVDAASIQFLGKEKSFSPPAPHSSACSPLRVAAGPSVGYFIHGGGTG